MLPDRKWHHQAVTSTGSDGWVRYKERAGTGPWLHRWTRRLRKHAFAAVIKRPVSCDWTPDTDETS